MNKITYEEALGTLKAMFPEWDEETLATILESNSYHVERTIETILSMSGQVDSAPPPQSAPQAAPQAAPQVDRSNANPSPSRSLSNESREGVPFAQPAPSSGSRYRGRMCSLPDDFLRPPGYSPRIIADEELALMLQNELFRREAQRILGEDFNRAVRGNRQGGAAAGGGRGQAAATAGRKPGDPASSADLGIMKTLNSMGGAAKRNLSQLAERFSQSSKARRPSEGPGREFKPLVDGGEDDFEIINFDSKANRNKHRLQDGGNSKNNHDDDDDDDEEFGYKNPLFRQGAPGGEGTNDVNR